MPKAVIDDLVCEPKELKDTVEFMVSEDWADRLYAEYYQLKIRLEGLEKFSDSEKFKALSEHQRVWLIAQTGYMKGYLKILNERLLSVSEPLPAA